MTQFEGRDLLCIRGERLVFSKLDFSIEPSGCLTLIGRNGAGKSSLLRMMAALLHPAGGTMTWEGEAVSKDLDEHRSRLHYVGHHDAIKPVLTVRENLKFWAGLRSDAKQAEANFEQALEVFSIAHLVDVPGRFLSAGQKRRVNLARILASRAPLWLLDEPTTALDKASIHNLENAIESHREKGGMVVLSTHSDMQVKDQVMLDVGDYSNADHHESAILLAEGV